MAQLSLVLLSESDALRDALAANPHLDVAAHLRDPDAVTEALRRLRPELLFADLGDTPERVLEVLEAAPAPRPSLLVSGPQHDSELILRAMRLGAREFLSPDPQPEAIDAAIERLLLEHRPPEPVTRRAPILSVMGAKGGVGATFLACQLAAELEKLGGRSVVVDLNLRLGDVSLYFDLQPRYTLANLASDRDDFDSAYLHTILEAHSSGVHVLAAPQRAEEAEYVRSSHLERAAALLRQEFDWVLLDLSRSWDETSVRALDLSDEILLVTLLDLPTLNHARQHLDLLQRLGQPAEKLRLIANRHAGSSAFTEKDVESFLGRGPDACIPNDYPSTQTALNEGRPLCELAPRSRLRAAYAALAKEMHDWCEVPLPSDPADPSRTGRRSWRLTAAPWRKRHAAG